MASLAEVITHALAPGIALTSAIIYNSTLQARIVHITVLVRELNKEARERMEDPRKHEARLDSIRLQVQVLTRRARMIRYGISVTFFAYFCFILTILGSLATGVFFLDHLAYPSLVTFALGFSGLGLATLFTGLEVFLGHQTLKEDIESSHTGPSYVLGSVHGQDWRRTPGAHPPRS